VVDLPPSIPRRPFGVQLTAVMALLWYLCRSRMG